MKDMRDWLTRLREFTGGAWRVLPLESLAVATAVVTLMLLVPRTEHGAPFELWMLRLFCGAVLLTPLFFAMTLLCAHGVITRRVKLAAGAVAAPLVLGALVYALREVDDLSTSAFLWPYGLALLAATLVPFVTVAIGPASERLERFTTFVRRFFEQTTTWGLLWGVGAIAVGVVFVALDELFDLEVENVALDSIVALTGVCVLVYLHRLLPNRSDQGGRLPELWRRLATTVGAPFVSVMLVILVVYEASVLVRGELPRNLLSPLIIGAGFVGFLCTLVIVSLLSQAVGSGTLTPAEPHRWGRRGSIRLARAFPLVLLALLPMAGWALSVRIEQYGFTPFRVVRMMALLCLGVLCLLGAVRWLRGRTALTWEVPATVIVFALATAFGPANAVTLSLDSQLARFDVLLTEAGIDERDVAELPRSARYQVESETYDELYDSIGVIAELGGEAALRQVLTGEVEICAGHWRSYECLVGLGVERRGEGGGYRVAQVDAGLSGQAGTIVFIDLYPHSDASHRDERLSLRGQRLVLYRDGVALARASLAELIVAWRDTGTLPGRTLPLVGDDGVVFGEVAVRRLYGYDDLEVEGGIEVSNVEGVWLLAPRSEVSSPGPADE